MFHTGEKVIGRQGEVLSYCCLGLDWQQHAPSPSVAHIGTMQDNWHAKVGSQCETPGILGETGCKGGIHVGSPSLPGSAERWRRPRSEVYVWAPMPVCACEGGNREEAVVAGCLHAGNLGQWKTRMPLGAVQSLLVFRLQGLGNSHPTKDTPLPMPNVFLWIPSFLWSLVLGCGGRRGKGVSLHLREGSDIVFGAESLMLSWDCKRDLYHVTLTGTLYAKWLSWISPSPTNSWVPWTTGCVG